MQCRGRTETHYPVASGWGEGGLLLRVDEEVSLLLVKSGSKIIRLGLHDVMRQTEGLHKPLKRGVFGAGGVTDVKGHLDLQLVSILC